MPWLSCSPHGSHTGVQLRLKPPSPASRRLICLFRSGAQMILKGEQRGRGRRCGGEECEESQGKGRGGREEFTSLRYGEWVSEKMQKRRQRGREREKSHPNNFHPVGAKNANHRSKTFGMETSEIGREYHQTGVIYVCSGCERDMDSGNGADLRLSTAPPTATIISPPGL